MPRHLSDVDARAPLGIRLELAQHLARDRRRIAFAEGEKLQEIGNRIPFRPSEVDVRDVAGLVPDVEQEGGNRIRNRRTLAPAAPGGRPTSTPCTFSTSLNSEASPGWTSRNSTGSPGGTWCESLASRSFPWYSSGRPEPGRLAMIRIALPRLAASLM